MDANIREVLTNFFPGEEIVSVGPHGSGHINHTFAVETAGGKQYVLQQINTDIFRDVEGLMENVVNVTAYLRGQIAREGGDPERGTMRALPAADGRYYYQDAQGGCWRIYVLIDNVISLDQAENEEALYASGLAFGRFQAQLADYPAHTLHETIPDFHNTPKRYQTFEEAVEKDLCHRAASAAEEIAFIRARKKDTEILTDLLRAGELPLRLTHNDTKLNNVLLDPETYEAVCIVDFDTIMPGLTAYDFGDAIRFGANTAVEDEPDISKVSLSLPLYKAYVKGFLEGCGGRLTAKEMETLPQGAKTITLEQGIRFLTDYLQGDTYYQTSREGQNLDRCRTQLALVADMEKKWKEMQIEITTK